MHKIVIINNWLISGGAEKQGLILAKTLNQHYKVYFCIYYSHKIEEKFINEVTKNNIELILLKGNHLSKFSQFYNLCRKEQINIIISYLFAGNILNSIIGSILKVKHRIGGIRNSKDTIFKQNIQRLLHNNLLTHSISNSYKGKEECIKLGYKSEKFTVIHNSFELKSMKYLHTNSKVINIITVARFVEQKDYLTSIKAVQYAIVNSAVKNINYIIIGYGHLEPQIRKWIKEYNIQDYTTVLINPKDVENYLINSHIYLSTSLFEGLSNSIMEGMSCSLPIVATNAGDNSSLVLPGFNGYLTEKYESEKIGKYILELAGDPEKRKLMGENSLQYLKENFSHEIFEKKYLTFLNNLPIK